MAEPEATEVEEQDDVAGRFPGDLYARLDYDPIQKKPYRVCVWVWRQPVFKADGDNFDWYQSKNVGHGFDEICGGFDHEKHFKKLDQAVSYLYDVLGSAELRRLYRRVQEDATSRRVVLSG
jgi:hypothetical protein